MIVVFAIDALEYDLVGEFNCKNLKQISYGKTNISEFSQPRTMVLWSSFMTGQNKEDEILAKGDKEMWNTKIPLEQTFFSDFKNPKIIDLPGYSYDKDVHDKSRHLLKNYFETNDKEKVLAEYNKDAFEHHKNVKKEFLEALDAGHDFVLGYFSVADVIGHLNFGNKDMMQSIYKELDELAGQIQEKADALLILSDHGMKAVGRFGDHSNYGFWSFDKELKLQNPKITDFAKIILSLRK